ncbi:MAG: hypothetical protein HQM08_16505 [Candidatus Riflebacteria bacterium]|nr:hypothetical protein [Candidatus Riflebacteria bacterium]
MKKYFVFLIVFFSFFVLCPSLYALNNWTIMIYFVGDDADLIQAQINAINGLTKLGNRPNNYEIVILFKRPNQGALRLTFKDGKCPIEEKMGETNMGSPNTLWNFMKCVVTQHPAKQYALIIGSHGSGIYSWLGTGSATDKNPGAVDFNADKFVAYDNAVKDCLTVFEVQSVLESFKSKLNAGRALNLLFFDCCLPGSVEALYQLSQSAEVVVSSPERTIIGGTPYVTIMSQLAGNPSLTPEQFGEIIAKSYMAHSNADAGGVMGAFRPAKSDRLIGAIDLFSIELLKAWQSGNKIPLKNLMPYGSDGLYYDLGTILVALINGNLSGISNGSAIKQAAQDVLEEIKQVNIGVWASGRYTKNNVVGISIAWPKREHYVQFHQFYKTLAFSKATHWDEFLDSYFGLSQ